jgi:hypothetical protein
MFSLVAILSQRQKEKYLYSLFDGIFLTDPNYIIQNDIIRLEDKYLVFTIQGSFKYSNIFPFCDIVLNIFPNKVMFIDGTYNLEYVLIAQEIKIYTIIKSFTPITTSFYIGEYSLLVTLVIPR